MLINKNVNGYIVISDIVNGYIVTRKYMYYTTKQAKKLFKNEIENERKNNEKWNK